MWNMILCSLALTAALVCAVMTASERKRSREQRALVHEDVNRLVREYRALAEKLETQLGQRLAEQNEGWTQALRQLQEQVDSLSSGAVPDYEKARAAAKAVDDFHTGIANVLNFDPYQAMRKSNDSGGGV